MTAADHPEVNVQLRDEWLACLDDLGDPASR